MSFSRRGRIARHARAPNSPTDGSRTVSGLGWPRRAYVFILCCALALAGQLLASGPSLGDANEGIFAVLDVNDAPTAGDTLHLEVMLLAITRVEASSLTVRIISESGAVVVALVVDPVRPLQPGETWGRDWSLTNDGFPEEGTYTVHGCWSMGQASTCNVAEAVTTFYSVPTLGPLGLVAMVGGIAMITHKTGQARADPQTKGA